MQVSEISTDAVSKVTKAVNKVENKVDKVEGKVLQIGNDTALTVTKVDKLNISLKTFIKVMTDVVVPIENTTAGSKEQINNLQELVEFLEEEEERAEMEIDNDRKRKPPPDIEDVLRGEGSKKYLQ